MSFLSATLTPCEEPINVEYFGKSDDKIEEATESQGLSEDDYKLINN